MKKFFLVLLIACLLIGAMLLMSCQEEEPAEHVHTYTERVVYPDCQNEGYTEYKCTGCDYVYRDNVTARDPSSHTYGPWYVFTESTCVEKGVERQDCKYCDGFKTREIKELADHIFDDGVVVSEATCTQSEYSIYTCEVCGLESKSTSASALGHDYCDWYTTKDHSCDEYGEERRDCQRDNCDYYQTTPIPSHDGHVVNVVAPTCTEVGYTIYQCDLCGEIYRRDYRNCSAHTYGDWYFVEGFGSLQRRDCTYCGHFETSTNPKK